MLRSILFSHALITNYSPNYIIMFFTVVLDTLQRRNLLLNLGTRHLIIPIDYKNLTGQALKIVHVDMANFFMAASPNGISDMLAKASSPNITNGPYFSDEFAWHSMSMVSRACKRFLANMW